VLQALERIAIAATPAVALVTVAVGLRVGASSRAVGARVYAPSPGRGREGVSLRLVTIADEGGVVETVSVPAITVVAMSNGQSAEWHGSSNIEGVAESWLDLRGSDGDALVDLRVTTADGMSLAKGSVTVKRHPLAPQRSSEVSATRRAGDLRLELFVYGGRLVPGSAGRVVAHVRDDRGVGLDGVRLIAEPEPGVVVDRSFPATARGGWAEAQVTAEYLLAPWTVESRAPDGRAGSWYGALPIAAGGATVDLPERVESSVRSLRFVVPPASRRLYVWVVDTTGVDVSAALDVTDGVATLDLPPLSSGTYWLYTAAGSHGVETNEASTVARPFVVANGSDGGDSYPLMTLTPPSVTYDLLLDGLAAPRERARTSRRKGVQIGLSGLLLAGLLETLLLFRAVERGRAKMRMLADAATMAGVAPLGRARASGAAALILATLLGFVLLAALLVVRDGK
jgi:hypothetical protein